LNYYSEGDIRQIVEDVIRRCAPCDAGPQAEADISIPVEVSARHVHLTREAVIQLFGPDHALVSKRALSQPGEFLSEDRVKIVTAKGEFSNVAVLGPERSHVQVELSAADCRTLGINAPLRLSGNLEGAADVLLIGPCGMLMAKQSAIVAMAHIHMTDADAARLHVSNGDVLTVALDTERPVTLRAIARVKQRAALAMHIDFDEANAAMAGRGTNCHIVRREAACAKKS